MQEPIWFHVGESFRVGSSVTKNQQALLTRENLLLRTERFFNDVVADGRWVHTCSDSYYFAYKFAKHARNVQGFSVYGIDFVGSKIARILLVSRDLPEAIGLHVNLPAYMCSRHLGYFRPMKAIPQTVAVSA